MFDLNRALENLKDKLDTVEAKADKLREETEDRSNQLSELNTQVDQLIARLPEDQRQRVIERLKNHTDTQE